MPCLVGLFCFQQYLSASGPAKGTLDKKLYQQVWALCKRVPLDREWALCVLCVTHHFFFGPAST